MWRKWGFASWHSQPKAEAEAPLLEWSLGEPVDHLLNACKQTLGLIWLVFCHLPL